MHFSNLCPFSNEPLETHSIRINVTRVVTVISVRFRIASIQPCNLFFIVFRCCGELFSR